MFFSGDLCHFLEPLLTEEIKDFKKTFVQDDAFLGKGFYRGIGDATLSRKRNYFKGMNYFNNALQS